MSTQPWWRDAVVYQVYPRSFADSDGDGIGDLRGLIDHLDHIAGLGIDVLWVSPFYPSPQVDNGYDISDYRGVDPVFGTMEDVDDLVEQVHARGMKLVIDVVVNHTSDQHPWFLESRASTDNPKRDWYWWRDPKPGVPASSATASGTTDAGTTAAGTTASTQTSEAATTDPPPGSEPTNWLSFFSQPAWTWDQETGQYWLHLFTPEQPDLNWENPDVRAAVHEMLSWWLARGIDGFRMDVINLVSKTMPLRDGPLLDGGPWGDGFDLFCNGPRIHEYLNEVHREVIAPHGKVLLTVGEMPHVSVDQAIAYTDPAREEVDMVFHFEHVGVDHGPGGRYDPVPLDLVALKQVMDKWQTGLADVGWNSLYWNNHDQPRAVSRFGSDAPAHRVRSAKLLGTVLHMHRGTPYVYQGEELGMTNHPFTAIEQYDDVETRNYYAYATARGRDPDVVLAGLAEQSRDHARTPMQWDDSSNAGFTTGTPWLP
ncbi:MAG TPA: alpha-glucosidase, partial [Nitriliruptoraceae bacterium]|nr:alpha-glucosidase [Nitriliruptoraceae bacterium]